MHQYLFYIGDFPIRMYGLTLCTAIFLAIGTAYFLAKQDGRWHEHVLDIGIYGGFAGLIGGRLWDVFFFDWAYYQNHLLEIPYVWQGGMAVQGGMLAGILTGVVYCKRNNIDVLSFGDITCPSYIMGQAIGRIANLLNGDAFGSPTGGNFGILYPEGTLAYKTYGTQPLWPAEVWECQGDIIIFVLLLLLRTTDHKKGQVLFVYPMLYSILRFFLEMLRGDYAEPWALGMTSGQATSVGFFLLGLVGFIYCTLTQDKFSKDAPKKA